MADTGHYKCKFCNKNFKHHGHRNRHEQQVHHDGGKVECNDCGAVFSRMENLNRHRKSHGIAHSNLKCSICQKIFGRRDSLNQHQRQVHGGVRYDCEHCKVTFAQKYKLKKHLEKHSMSKGGKSTQDCHQQEAQAYNHDAGPSTSKQSEMDQRQGTPLSPYTAFKGPNLRAVIESFQRAPRDPLSGE